ncbi:hypothetical protein [Photorhabdus sp. RM71S]|uniref:hypothetical protein n=1 Tax=Photorhabdus sp. RM71S TaxID=3342824 RepID=UPI0036DF51F6
MHRYLLQPYFIDASRNLVLHRAHVTGRSEETTQEIVKIMGRAGIAAASGVAGGISKADAKVINSDQSQQANADKGAQAEATKTSHSQTGNAAKGTTGNISTFNPNEIRFSDPRRGLEPKTWGEAITGRINKQTGGFSKSNPDGSDELPRITGKSKD